MPRNQHEAEAPEDDGLSSPGAAESRLAYARHPERVEALRKLELLDTPPEAAFDRITSIARGVFDVPIALVSLVDEDRQWFKSCVGLDACQTGLDKSFCAHAILSDDPLVVRDAADDPRFASNPAVTDDPFVRFYAGIPLKARGGHRLGTLCIIDRIPRELTEDEVSLLDALGRTVETIMEARADARRTQEQSAELRRLATIVGTSEDAIITKSLDGTITSWNAGAERTYGYRAEEVEGKLVTILVPDTIENDVPAILAKIKAGERIPHYETKRRTKAGDIIDVSLSVSPLRNDSGDIVGASVIARDITAAVRLRAAAEEQADMLDLAQDAIMARDLDGVITYWNVAAEQLYGWTKAEAVGRVSHQLLETTFPTTPDEIQNAVVREGRWEGEVVHRTRSGDKVVVGSRWGVHRKGDGALQILEINNDVTHRKAMEAALAERQEMLTAIFETSPDIIATISSRLELRYVNSAAREILGYEFEELFRENSLHWVHPDDVATAVELVQSAFQEETTGAARLRVKRATGDWISLDLRIRRVKGAPDTAVVMARDVTTQVRLEQDLTRAKHEADEANLAKSQFLSRMSHELRTPLNAILGFGQLLAMDEQSPDERESTEQILKGGRRLLELINEVLDISRIESGSLQLSLEPVPVGEVARDAVDLIRPLANERGIEIRIDLDEDMSEHHVMADQQRFGQILLNLLSNAVKYNVENGSVTVTAAIGTGDRIRIGVIDTGPGIPREKISLLFAPFERLGAEQTTVEGTGLGLALSKNLAEAMGGRLEAETMPGGTAFWVELPAGEAPSGDAASRSEREDDPSSDISGKVLYIEDNLSNLRLIERLLSNKKGVALISAMTGTLGIEMAQQHVPDLILLDLHLPDLRGEEVLVRLRKDPRTRTIPMIILSADATPGQIERLRAMGATEYLTKPMDIVQFTDVVDRLLDASVVTP